MATILDHNPYPQNFYAALVRQQRFAVIPELQLDSGERLRDCPVAFRTWGSFNDAHDNVLVICHALTGSSDVTDWWNTLIGPGKAFDPQHFFIFCGNVLGSPYGSASPLTNDPQTGQPYASDFPQTTIRDDIRAHKHVLDALGVSSVAAVIGGSMGGMTTLEWPLCTSQGYIRSIIPIATAAEHSAWGISWAEAQRQCIYADPCFNGGCYEPHPDGQPAAGLSAARMVAMLTYRSGQSFDARFGRNPPRQMEKSPVKVEEPLLDLPRVSSISTVVGSEQQPQRRGSQRDRNATFSAQGYLHYQGDKFIKRFDANCYLHLTFKMDSHDLTRGRESTKASGSGDDLLQAVLENVPAGALVIGVESDVLFPPPQQERLAACLPGASMAILKSTDGHDGFLLEFEQLNVLIKERLKTAFPLFYEASRDTGDSPDGGREQAESLTGEVEKW